MKKFILVIPILLLATLGCNSALSQIEPTTAPTIQAISTQGKPNIPATEADVPRITVEDAKAAVDDSEAIIVDVRSADSFAAGHVSGAINIPLADIENNPSGVKLDKGQWIITYCT
jgi:3-mercaptopyruvate sulfurtransferase SseA